MSQKINCIFIFITAAISMNLNWYRSTTWIMIIEYLLYDPFGSNIVSHHFIHFIYWFIAWFRQKVVQCAIFYAFYQFEGTVPFPNARSDRVRSSPNHIAVHLLIPLCSTNLTKLDTVKTHTALGYQHYGNALGYQHWGIQTQGIIRIWCLPSEMSIWLRIGIN